MQVLPEHARVFDGLKPWAGQVPVGFSVDFVGTLIDLKFRTIFQVHPDLKGGQFVATQLPTIEDGEGWFEAFNWVEAARAARDNFTMITLGACYGGQAVGMYRALHMINPMPSRFVAVEGEPENFVWMQKHMRDNGMDPDAQWLVNTAVSNSNAPVLFPVGWPGLGIGNCFSTNEDLSRKVYADELIASGRANEALQNLLLNNSTGIVKNMVPGENYPGEIKVVSAVTLRDLLSPFEVVDFLESDIQQSEIVVFPPFMDLLKRKVRRVHMGTHGKDVHDTMVSLFQRDGWEIVFAYDPDSRFTTPFGSFRTFDGVLTARNPNL